MVVWPGPCWVRGRFYRVFYRVEVEQERSTPLTLALMTADQLEAFATRYTAAWCSHDPNAAASFFAEDGSIAVNGGEPAVGRAAIAELVQGFYDAFPDTVVIMDRVRGAADKAVYLWTYEGTNTGPGGTGHTVRFNGWESWTFSPDGLVAVSLGNFDVAEYERQLAEGV
jgi:uncharacterized protein (TIGR02246 family)